MKDSGRPAAAFLDLTVGQAESLKSDIDDLLSRSMILRWNPPGSRLISIKSYAWSDLDEQAHQLQARILKDYERFAGLIQVLTRKQSDHKVRGLEQARKDVRAIVAQDGHTHHSNIQVAGERAREAIDEQLASLGELYDPGRGKAVIVPDTNALIHNPNLEDWKFSGLTEFRIVLTPTVLAELDRLKVEHRNEPVRDKAEKLIRKIKEYRRRGRLTDGVTLVRDVIELAAVAPHPSFEATLPWLDPNSEDDCYVASFVELIRENLRSQVFAVTRDINLQNKLEWAGLPFLEPPEPSD